VPYRKWRDFHDRTDAVPSGTIATLVCARWLFLSNFSQRSSVMRLAMLAAVPVFLAAAPALAAPDYPDYSSYPDSTAAESTVVVTPRVDSTTTVVTPLTSSENTRIAAANAARENYYRDKLEAAQAQARVDSALANRDAAIADREAAQDRAAADREAAEDAEANR